MDDIHPEDATIVSEVTLMIKDVITFALEEEYKDLSRKDYEQMVSKKTIEVLVKLSEKWSLGPDPSSIQ